MIALAAGLVLTVGSAAVPAGHAAQEPAPSTAPTQPSSTTATVTLITGDVVSYATTAAGVQVVDVTPAAGREHVGFSRVRLDGHELVVPADATDLIADGRVDERLFDVTELVAAGYTDEATDHVPVIINSVPGAARTAHPAGVEITDAFPAVGMSAADVDKESAATAWAALTGSVAGIATSSTNGPSTIWLDGQVHATLDESAAAIGAPEAWDAGYTGAGVTVAVLDSGYDIDHPDLVDAVVASHDFTWEAEIDDYLGHGTHVAGIIAGSGAASDGRIRGIAPDVDLLVGKVLTSSGNGRQSDILAGMEWAAANDADVVNMSLGSRDRDGIDPLEEAVNRLTAEAGVLFVIAAGNEGEPMSVGSPGSAAAALTVGSVTKDGAVSDFSSRGPGGFDYAVKPEVAAPGSGIVAARGNGAYPDGAVIEHYATLSGTSMASPHVAGAAALLLQAHPDWTPEQIKAALTSTADEVSQAGVFEVGSGVIDVPAAIDATVTARATASSTPHFTWPLADNEPVTWGVEYANAGDRPVRLRLAVDADADTPANLFTLSDRNVTVPAGGTTTIAVTADPVAADPVAAETGTFGAVITARSPHGVVRTPVGIVADGPTFELTVLPRDPSEGTNAVSAPFLVQNEDTGEAFLSSASTQPRVLTLPAGTYRLIGHVWELERHVGAIAAQRAIHFGERVVLDGDRTVDLNAGEAKPVTIDFDRDDLQPMMSSGTGTISEVPGGGAVAIAPTALVDHDVYALAGPQMPGLTFFGGGAWQSPWVVVRSGDEVLEYEIFPYLFAGWVGDAEGEVVDVGKGEDLDGQDFTGKIVLYTPDFTVPLADRTARLKAIAAAGAALVIISDFVTYDNEVPLLKITRGSLINLRERLAEGPLTMRLTGLTNPDSISFTHHEHTGSVPGGIAWTAHDDELATIETTATNVGYPGDMKAVYGWVQRPDGLIVQQLGGMARAPYAIDVRVPAGVPWRTATYHLNAGGPNGVIGDQYTEPRIYEGGRAYQDSWLQAPFNPSLSVPTFTGRPAVSRDADTITVDLGMFSDATGHISGYNSGHDTGTTVLTDDDGTVLARNNIPGRGVFPVPRQNQWYRLSVDAVRDGGGQSPGSSWPLSDVVRTQWRFPSHHTGDVTALPLLDVRYDLPLNGFQEVPVGADVTFTLDVAPQAGSDGAEPASEVGVWYSTDDGESWTAAAVSGSSEGWQVTVPGQPRGRVSLKVSASDQRGNEVVETILRAYESGCVEYWCDTARPDTE